MLFNYYNYANLIVNNYYAITLNTSISILLNSSKHAHAPYYANPLNNLFIVAAVI